MRRSEETILAEIAAFAPRGGNWRALDSLLAELFAETPSVRAVPALLAVFERFPTEDGAGVLWGIVHGLEALPYDYCTPLRVSQERTPSLMAGVMLRRLANAVRS
jgi:hypothetical protein